jgi:hypothetical protein
MRQKMHYKLKEKTYVIDSVYSAQILKNII